MTTNGQDTDGTVHFLPDDIEVEAGPEDNLLSSAAAAGIEVSSPCAGAGKCGKCQIIVRGSANAPTAAEKEALTQSQLEEGRRLACQAKRTGECTVIVPEESRTMSPRVHDTFTFDLSLVALRPNVAVEVEGNNKSVLVAGRWFECTSTDGVYGIAFDIGTTTIVGYLVNLESGKLVTRDSTLNSQAQYGADVISRIAHALDAEGREELRRAVLTSANEVIAGLVTAAKIPCSSVYEAVLAGNMTMMHLLYGLDVAGLSQAPFETLNPWIADFPAASVGLEINPEANVHSLPGIKSFVGADTTAMILATQLRGYGTALSIDIGTNGEIALWHEGRLLVCSTAAGPALEGVEIVHGMRAEPGAIDHVYLNGDDLDVTTIAGAPPRGICGSGLVDALAELRHIGLVDETGYVLGESEAASAAAKYLRDVIVGADAETVMLLSESEERQVFLTQRDVRKLQLAKGAIRAGAEILMETAGATAEDLEVLLLAGAFGANFRKDSVLRIGLLPSGEHEKVQAVGNAAGLGALLSLLNTDYREEALDIANSAEHIELAANPSFQVKFADAMMM